MFKRVIKRFVMATIVAVLSSWVLVPGMTEAVKLTVVSGRVQINGEVITDFVSRQMFTKTGNATHAAMAAQLIQDTLNEAIYAWRTQGCSKCWSTIIAQAMDRKRRVIAEDMVRLSDELEGLTGENDTQEFMAVNDRLLAYAHMPEIISRTSPVLQSLYHGIVFLLKPQLLSATPPPVAPVPSQTRPGEPCPGARLVPDPRTNGLNWRCP